MAALWSPALTSSALVLRPGRCRLPEGAGPGARERVPQVWLGGGAECPGTTEPGRRLVRRGWDRQPVPAAGCACQNRDTPQHGRLPAAAGLCVHAHGGAADAGVVQQVHERPPHDAGAGRSAGSGHPGRAGVRQRRPRHCLHWGQATRGTQGARAGAGARGGDGRCARSAQTCWCVRSRPTEPHPPIPTEADKAEKEAQREKELGNECYKAKKFDDAISHYNKAIELDTKARVRRACALCDISMTRVV